MQIKVFHKDDLKEKYKTRTLYEENFDDGKDYFIDYYYDKIIKRNEIIAILDGDIVVSMIHLNPYNYQIFDKINTVHYLVAIATKVGYRNKGYMSELFNAALFYLNDLHEPFCYLLPEDQKLEEYYKKFGFESICKFTVDKFSKQKYDIYPVNDQEYIELMQSEDKFLKLETKEYIDDLSKKNVMIKLLNNCNSLSFEKLKMSNIYICQEV